MSVGPEPLAMGGASGQRLNIFAKPLGGGSGLAGCVEAGAAAAGAAAVAPVGPGVWACRSGAEMAARTASKNAVRGEVSMRLRINFRVMANQHTWACGGLSSLPG